MIYKMTRLSAIRKARGYTQEELARKLNINANTLSHLENGTKKPSRKLLIKLADTLDVSVDWLLGRKVNRKEE